jgi:tetratricopeptide (TPR) repeat protein
MVVPYFKSIFHPFILPLNRLGATANDGGFVKKIKTIMIIFPLFSNINQISRKILANSLRSTGTFQIRLSIFISRILIFFTSNRAFSAKYVQFYIAHIAGYCRLVERTGDMAAIEAASNLCDRALDIISADRHHPLLGELLGIKGYLATRRCERTGRVEDAQLAVAQYEDALARAASRFSPLQEASVRAGLGTALVRLGEREHGTQSIERAVAELKRAVALVQPQSDPVAWTTYKNTLATSLCRLGERTNDATLLGEARDHLVAALEFRRKDNMPIQWAATKTDLGNVLVRLGEQTGDDTCFHDAIAVFGEALGVIDQSTSPRDYGETQNNVAFTLMTLYRKSGERDLLARSVQAFEKALSGLPRHEAPLDWAVVQIGLSEALLLTGDDAALSRATSAIDGALEVTSPTRAPRTWQNAVALKQRVMAQRQVAVTG